MNNMLFYKRIIKCLVNEQVKGKCNNLCCVKDKVLMYEEYKESQDVFVKMGRMLCVVKERIYGYDSYKHCKYNGNGEFVRIYIRRCIRYVT